MADATANTSIYGPLIAQNQPFDVNNYLNVALKTGELRQQQAQTQKNNALSQLLMSPASYAPDGSMTPAARRTATGIDPKVGLELENAEIERVKAALKKRGDDDVHAQFQNEQMGRVASAGVRAFRESKDGGGTDEVANAAATEARNEAAKISGLSENDKNTIYGSPFRLNHATAIASFDPDYLPGQRLEAQIKKQEDANKIAQEGLTVKEAAEAERERSDRTREDRLDRIAASVAARGGKPPAGFEWDPGQPDMLRPIKGGPKDPNASNMSGRQAVYFNRVTSSANEAAAAIDNIVQLPVGTSSGWFGVGSSPGHSLFSSAKGVLTNKMSSDDVQSYNTMLPGIKRNLATIESAGLAPSGSLTENFAGLELREGDTQMTKLRKLAEMRQIIEKGIETNLDDPHVPEPQKDLVRRIIGQVSKSVPFTQNDITRLQREQQRNPDITLEQLMKSKGLGGNGSAPSNGSNGARSSADRSSGSDQLKPGDKFKHPSGATVEILN